MIPNEYIISSKSLRTTLIVYRLWVSLIIPDELRIQFVPLHRHDQLIVLALHHIAVSQHPSSSSLGLVVLEVSLKIRSIRVCPFSRQKPVLHPLSNVLHAGGIEHIGPLAMLLSIQPVAREDVLVGVDEHAFS